MRDTDLTVSPASGRSAADTADEFVRHRGPVTCVAEIPGTNRVVTSGYDAAVGMFDLSTGEVRLLGYHRHLVNRVTVNSSGTLAATASSDYTIVIWDLSKLAPAQILFGHADDVEDFVFVDDSVGASVSRDWRGFIWDIHTGRITRVLEGHEKDALSVTHSAGSLFTSGDDMTLRQWRLADGKLERVWGPFASETDTCAIDGRHGRAVLGCDDGVVRVFDIASGDALVEIPAHSSGVKKVAVSPVNGDILSAAYDQRVRIWNWQDFQERTSLEGHPALWERSFNWTMDGQRVLAGTFDGTVVVWDAESGRQLAEVGNREAEPGNACLNEVAATGDGRIVLVSDDGRVRTARLTEDEASWLGLCVPASGRVLMNAVAVDSRGERVLCGAHDHRLHFLHLAADGELAELGEEMLNEGPINSIRVSDHEGWDGVAFVGCYSGAIVRVSANGGVEQRFRLHENAVKALRLHPDRTLGVSCSADGILVSWDFDGNLITRFPGHTAIIDDVDIDPSGRWLATVGRDFLLHVYDLADGRLCHAVPLGRRSPKAVCFVTPDAVVVTNYWGELIRVEMPSEDITRRWIAGNGISAAARSGDHLVVTSYDGGAYLVRHEDLHVVRELRAMTQRVGEQQAGVW